MLTKFKYLIASLGLLFIVATAQAQSVSPIGSISIFSAPSSGGGGGSGTVTSISNSDSTITLSTNPCITTCTISLNRSASITWNGNWTFGALITVTLPDSSSWTSSGVTGMFSLGVGEAAPSSGQIAATGLINETTLGSATAVQFGLNSAKTGIYATSQDSDFDISVNGTLVADFNKTNSQGFTFVAPSGISVNAAYQQTTTLHPSLDLNSSGANWGQITNTGADSWALGYGGNATTNGTAVITWTDNGAVTLTPITTVILNKSTYFSCTALTTNGSGVLGCTASDARVKNDLGTVVSANGQMPALHKFTFKNGYGPEGVHYGWFAQDIEKLYPELVHKGQKTSLTPDGEKQFDKLELVTLLVAKQQKEIDDLKAHKICFWHFCWE